MRTPVRSSGPQEREPAARHDPLSDRRPCGADRVGECLLPTLELGLGRGADADDRHAAGEFGEPLLELLPVVVPLGLGDEPADLRAAVADRGLVSPAADDRGGVAIDRHAGRRPKVGRLYRVQRHAEVRRDQFPAAEDCHVLQQRPAPVAVARRLDGDALEDPAQPVDDQGGERLGLDGLRDHHQRPAGRHDPLEERKELLHAGDPRLVEEDQRVFQDRLLAFAVGDEVRGEQAAVELHPVHHLDRRLRPLRLLHCHHAVAADPLHRLGHEVAQRQVVVG